MSRHRIHRHRIRKWVQRLNHFASRWWYGPLLAFLSAADAFILVVPNEVILVVGVLANRKRWLSLALWITVGSALGGVLVAGLVSAYGQRVLEYFGPSVSVLTHSHTWKDSVLLIQRFGAWGLALISLSPLPQHAAIVLVGFAHVPLTHVFLGILLGRAIKYLLCAAGAAYAPETLVRWHLVPRWVVEADSNKPSQD